MKILRVNIHRLLHTPSGTANGCLVLPYLVINILQWPEALSYCSASTLAQQTTGCEQELQKKFWLKCAEKESSIYFI